MCLLSSVYHKLAFAIRAKYFIVPVIAGKRKDSFRSIGAFEAPLTELEDVLGRVAKAAAQLVL